MLTKRLTHIGSTLRARSADDTKARSVAGCRLRSWRHVHSGAVKPLILPPCRWRRPARPMH
jgi:NADPH2:quinone reductase